MDAADMAYQRVQQGLDVLRQYPPGTGNRQLDLQRHSSYRGPNRPARSNGKRPSIDGLPDDWMDKVQAEVRAQDKPAVAAMAITGCRPAECDGIKVRQRTEVITFSVRGAKLDEDRGIAVRQISVSRDELQKTQAGRDIADWLGNRPVRTITVRSSTEAFCERVSRAADRAEISQVSAYTYRHHEARTLKQSGMDRSEIATRLGHRSDRSQSAYG
jgi:integrase